MKKEQRDRISRALKRAWKRRRNRYGARRVPHGSRYPVLPCGCDPARTAGNSSVKHIAIMRGGDRYCGLHKRVFRLGWAEVVAATIDPAAIHERSYP